MDIEECETLIAEWYRKNSQSNPAAMMELRELKKILKALQSSAKVKTPPKGG